MRPASLAVWFSPVSSGDRRIDAQLDILGLVRKTEPKGGEGIEART